MSLFILIIYYGINFFFHTNKIVISIMIFIIICIFIKGSQIFLTLRSNNKLASNLWWYSWNHKICSNIYDFFWSATDFLILNLFGKLTL